MTQSTTNLLQAVNQLMLMVGERQVSDLTSYPAQKALIALGQALQDISGFNNWDFCKAQTVATSWLLDTATVDNMRLLYKVTFNSTSGARPLVAVPRENFPHNFTQSGTPSTYCVGSYNEVKFSPYPGDVDTKAAIIFHYQKELVMPTVTTDKFPIPESMVSVLVKGACAYLHQLHLDDQGAFKTYFEAFQSALYQARNSKIGRVKTDINMYRSGG